MTIEKFVIKLCFTCFVSAFVLACIDDVLLRHGTKVHVVVFNTVVGLFISSAASFFVWLWVL